MNASQTTRLIAGWVFVLVMVSELRAQNTGLRLLEPPPLRVQPLPRLDSIPRVDWIDRRDTLRMLDQVRPTEVPRLPQSVIPEPQLQVPIRAIPVELREYKPAELPAPPPPPRRSMVGQVVPFVDDDRMAQVRALIQRWNDADGLRRTLHGVQGAWELTYRASREIGFTITSPDPTGEIAKLIVQKLTERAVEWEKQQLKAKLAEVERNIYAWYAPASAQRAIALAEVQRYARWVDRVVEEAGREARERLNQQVGTDSRALPKASITVLPGGSTTHIHFREGLALRQLRDANNHPDWKRGLNEKK
jgi:hypothetical protein